MRLLWNYFCFFFWAATLGKRESWRFEIALGLFFYIFFGGDPWKRESGDLRLFWDYLSIFLGGNPWKRESGDLRLLCDYLF